jgi:hypothetical protein
LGALYFATDSHLPTFLHKLLIVFKKKNPPNVMGKGGKGLASSLSTEPDDDEYFGDLLKKFRKNCPDCKSSDTKVLNALKKKLADWDHEIAVPNSIFGQVAKALAPSPKTSAGNTAAKTAKQPNKPKSVPKRSATKKTIVANTQVDLPTFPPANGKQGPRARV